MSLARPTRLRAARALGIVCLLLWPLGALAGRAYVSNEDGDSVSVLDTATGDVIATVPVGKRPRGLKLSRDGSRLYVAVSGLPKCPPPIPEATCAKLQRDPAADGVAVVDTRSLRKIKLLEVGSDPEQLELGDGDRRLYVSNEDTASVTVVDIPTAKVITRIAVGHEPEGVRKSPDGAWVGVTSEADATVSLIDNHLLQLGHVASVGQRPRDLAFTPDGRTAYVSAEFDAAVYSFAVPSGGHVSKLIQLRKQDRPMGVLLDPARRLLYVSTGHGGTIAVISLAPPSGAPEARSGTPGARHETPGARYETPGARHGTPRARLVAEIPVGARPWGIALSPDRRLLYVANGPSNDVSIVDTITLRVIKKVAVGRSPWGVVVGR